MRAAMRHWKPDAEEMLLDGEHLLGQCLLFPRPSLIGKRTGPFQIDGCCIVADAFLHDRNHILQILSRSGETVMPDAGDDELILRLYLAKGWQGLDQLIGDYTFAIFDGRNRELLIARDALGIRPMFWLDRNGQLVFASEPRGILSHPEGDSSIDQAYVVNMLAGLPPDPQSTFHQHIRILPPGHVLRASVFSVSLHRYVVPRIPSRIRNISRVDAQAGFLERFTEAVNCRIKGAPMIATELSGGLDSSAIACMAARLLSDPERLHVFSNVLPAGHAVELEDESRYIDAVVSHAGIRHVHRISHSGRENFQEALDLDIEVNGGVEYMTSMWLEPLRRRMEAEGINIVLSGFMGDHVVSHSGRNHWTDLAEEGHYLRFIASCLKHGRPDLLFSRTIKRFLPDALIEILGRIRARSPQEGSYLRKGLLVHPPKHSKPMPGPFPYKQHLTWKATQPIVARRLQNEALYGIRHRIIPAYPMADLRLIEWVLSLPVSAIGDPRTDRFLFRKSLEEVLPATISARRDKDIPAGIYFMEENIRFNQEVRKWVLSLRDQQGNPLLEMVDFDRVLADLDPQDEGNRWRGIFHPAMPFHLQALMRYAETMDRGTS
jgi:asparagine synthase (glutamine-hydrolysing)